MSSKDQPSAKEALQGYREYLQGLVKDWNAPGLSVAVVAGGEVVFAEGIGMRDPDKRLPATPQTLYAIGSCTKAFTALAVAMLADDGKLEWDKPVRHYIPWFKMFDRYVSDHLTPRDLLCHRAGLPRHEFMWYNSPLSRKELVERLQYLEPNLGFRQAFQYNNLMFMTAGYLIGEVTGSTWEEFVQKRILDPLGMSSTNFSTGVSQRAPDFALPCQDFDGEVRPIEFRELPPVAPAGALNSSVLDLSRWSLLHLNKGKVGDKTLVSEANLRETDSPQIVTGQMPGQMQFPELGQFGAYGMGWGVNTYRGHTWLEHGGGIDGFSALITFLPQEGIGVAALTNTLGTSIGLVAALTAFDLLLGVEPVDWNARLLEQSKRMKDAIKAGGAKAEEDCKGGTPGHPLVDYAGTYTHPGYGPFVVRVEGDGLKARYNQVDYDLAHCHFDVFRFKLHALPMQFNVYFRTDAKGNIGSLAVPFEPTVKDIVFVRTAEQSMRDPAFLARFVGEYDLMGSTVQVTLKDGALLISVPGQGTQELEPYQGTEFKIKAAPMVTFEFKLSASGAVEAVQVNQPGMVITAKKR